MDEQSIFLKALEKDTAEKLAAWLDASCGKNRQLRERVEALLRRHHEANGFLEHPVEALEATCLAASASAVSSGHASVLRSIEKRYEDFKSVSLHDADGDFEDPVVQPSSSQVPKSDSHSRYQFLGEIARGHFYGAAAKAMRQILVDSARRKNTLKRGRDAERLPFDGKVLARSGPSEELLELNTALNQLERDGPDLAELVSLRYFAGLSMDQAAKSLGISKRSPNETGPTRRHGSWKQWSDFLAQHFG